MKKITLLFSFFMAALILSGCVGKGDGNFVKNALGLPEEILTDMNYDGTAKIKRWDCKQDGQVTITLKTDRTFILKMTAPSVTANCWADGNQVSDVFVGTVDTKEEEILFTKCNVSEMPAEGDGEYTQKEISGTVDCFELDSSGKKAKWLSVDFEANRQLKLEKYKD